MLEKISLQMQLRLEEAGDTLLMQKCLMAAEQLDMFEQLNYDYML